MPEASDLYFRQIAVGQMANFAYLIGSRSTREALVVDPAWSVDALLDQAAADEMRIVGALVTHYHQDHVGGKIFGLDIEGVARLLEREPVPIHVNAHEAEGTRKVTGASESDLVRHEAGDAIELGQLQIRLLHTPGHTPGSQCFLVEERGQPGHLVSGDTLFLGSCGRVDLPGSDPEAMYYSLNRTLKELPDDTLVYPGHLYSSEPSASLGEQKRANPYLRVASLEQFLSFMGY
ncbi:MAG: MBL fold metallo-hydrolase [Myxococcales bacterium]|nr:MAG: MBL fold metallo-hydrolase [Myxococcales bacterium]